MELVLSAVLVKQFGRASQHL